MTDSLTSYQHTHRESGILYVQYLHTIIQENELNYSTLEDERENILKHLDKLTDFSILDILRDYMESYGYWQDNIRVAQRMIEVSNKTSAQSASTVGHITLASSFFKMGEMERALQILHKRLRKLK